MPKISQIWESVTQLCIYKLKKLMAFRTAAAPGTEPEGRIEEVNRGKKEACVILLK